MSFFDDNKNMGLAMVIIGIIGIIGMVIGFVLSAGDPEDYLAATVVILLGLLVTDIIYIMFGLKVRSGSNNKVKTLAGLVKVIGIALLIYAITMAIGMVLMDVYSVSFIARAVVVQVVFGILLLWASTKVEGSNKNIASNIVWAVLLVVFVILLLLSLIYAVQGIMSFSIDAIDIIIVNICWILVYLYALIALLSPQVKKSMGI